VNCQWVARPSSISYINTYTTAHNPFHANLPPEKVFACSKMQSVSISVIGGLIL
jgi:hypothetical protein